MSEEIQRSNQQEVSEKLHLLLRETYPQVFQKPYKPLAIGIHKMIKERHSDEFSSKSIHNYLSGFTRSIHYNRELVSRDEGDPRYDLDGNPSGVLTEQGIRHAAKAYLNRWSRIKVPGPADKALKERAEAILAE